MKLSRSPFLARGLQVDGCSRVHGCGLGNPEVPVALAKTFVTVYETPSSEQAPALLSRTAGPRGCGSRVEGQKWREPARAPPRLSLDCVRCGSRSRADPRCHHHYYHHHLQLHHHHRLYLCYRCKLFSILVALVLPANLHRLVFVQRARGVSPSAPSLRRFSPLTRCMPVSTTSRAF